MTTTNTIKIQIRNLDIDLHRTARRLALDRNISVNQLYLDLIAAGLKAAKKIDAKLDKKEK